MLKKIFTVIVSVVIALSAAVVSCGETIDGDSAGLQLGDYILFGRYNNEPILWRIGDSDVNGKLLISGELIDKRAFNTSDWYGKNYANWSQAGPNFWKTSDIRSWLNSTQESDFLSGGNFSSAQRGAIKTVVLPTKIDLYGKATNSMLYENMFLLDQQQCVEISKNLGSDYLKIVRFAESVKNKPYNTHFDDPESSWWLREPSTKTIITGTGEFYFGMFNLCIEATEAVANIEDNYFVGRQFTDEVLGIRPAFYLNEENARILSGSGTKEDPYVIDGKPIPERFEENGLYGYKDADGNVIVPAKYAKALPFSDGAALVATTDDPYHWRYIDTSGDYLFDKAFYASNNFNNGYALVLAGDEPIYRYIDRTGEWANGLVFEDAEDFCGGYARVKMNGRWGVVDQNFNFEVNCEYESKDEALNTLQNK